MTSRMLNLGNIQGDVLAGFRKPHETLLLLQFGEADEARRWVGTMRPHIVHAEAVADFNRRFSERGRNSPDAPQATWTNVGFTSSGLRHLGVAPAEVSALGEAFDVGMAARAMLLGDTGASAPARWLAPYGPPDAIHAMLIVASDDQARLEQQVADYRELATQHGVTITTEEHGHVLRNTAGHAIEHFGFRDSISQPAVRGIDAAATGPEGLLWPGEFVLGYETQDPASPGGDHTRPNLDPGPVPAGRPGWADDGAFLVYRRLQQDVASFKSFLAAQAAARGVPAKEVGALLMGRHEDGAPLVATSDASLNNFGYQGAEGVAGAAHVRKTNPRDDLRQVGSTVVGLAETQKHRMIRRGIPYGPAFDDAAPDNHERGLLFLAYQADIAAQFEHVQRNWANNFTFPPASLGREPGHDPVIGQPEGSSVQADRFFRYPPQGGVGRAEDRQGLSTWVTTTGGGYFFQPSLSALEALAVTNIPRS